MSAEMANEIKLISGRSHPELSGKVAKRYDDHQFTHSAILPFQHHFSRARRSSATACRRPVR
jgi:hypothetical protein